MTKPNRGFNLIELMIGLVLIAVLVVSAAPNFSIYLQNQKIRARAESILSGLQQARYEAMRTNTSVTFALVTGMPLSTDTALAVVADGAAGPNWVVAQVPGGTTPVTVLSSQSTEGGGTASSVVTSTGLEAIVFNPLGDTNATGVTTFTVTGPTASTTCTAGLANSVRCLNVRVEVSGQMKMCDPLANATGDTRRCV